MKKLLHKGSFSFLRLSYKGSNEENVGAALVAAHENCR